MIYHMPSFGSQVPSSDSGQRDDNSLFCQDARTCLWATEQRHNLHKLTKASVSGYGSLRTQNRISREITFWSVSTLSQLNGRSKSVNSGAELMK